MLELNIVRHKRGYHWRVFKNGNLFCTGTDPHNTEEEAEQEAVDTFCQKWEFNHASASHQCKKVYYSMKEAINCIKAELINLDMQTTRTFWVGDDRYIARKTNRKAGYVNLTITEG